MNPITKISVDEAKNLVVSALSDGYVQNEPVIVWLDNMLIDLVAYTDVLDVEGFALYFQDLDCRIAVLVHPLNIIKNGDNYRLSLPISNNAFKVDDGKLTTRVVIFADKGYSYFKEQRETIINQIPIIRQALGIPVFLLLPKKLMDNFDSDLANFRQYLCTEDKKDATERWLKRAECLDSSGKQIVDNFYLDFLKQYPQYIDDSFIGGTNYCHPSKGEGFNKKMINEVSSIIKLAYSKESKEEFTQLLSTRFKNGNLDFSIINNVLEKIPSEDWENWIKSKKLSKSDHDDNRLDFFKNYLCSSSFMGNLSEGIYEKLQDFHNRK